MSEEGYTTIFHPSEEGVSIHKKVHLPLQPANLQFSKGAKVIKKNYGRYQQIKMTKSVKRQTMYTAYHLFHRQ
jgi:hypothetical protein